MYLSDAYSYGDILVVKVLYPVLRASVAYLFWKVNSRVICFRYNTF